MVQRANQEQEKALATNDPTLMSDTATPAYYNQLVQDLQSISASGVTAIHLAKLTWGPITLQSPSTAQATTVEIWTTTYGIQGTLQQQDTNVYSLVQQGSAWKIQSDQHPDSRQLQPPSGSAGAPPSPGTTSPSVDTGKSVNWSGYSATGGTFTAVSADWTIPNVATTTTPAADATWVGIGGVSSTDLIQAGTQAIVQGGQITYAAWVETLPQAAQTVSLTVNPGDHVSVSIAQQSSGIWQVIIKDLTTSQTYQTTVNYQSSLSSAEWIEESPSAGRRLLLPLDNFGSVPFSNATTTENGQTKTIAQANGQSITMEVVAGQALATTSALGTDGSSFTVTRTNVAAPQISPRGRRGGG